MTPFVVKNKMAPGGTTKDGNSRATMISVPCGRCPACYRRRVSAWSFRLLQEYKVCYSAQFLTLTYDSCNVPLTSKGVAQLCKRDMQLFIKRLRKSHEEGTRIKYFAVGEYGGKTSRPHYHILLFNARVELVQSSWKLGNVHYGTVTAASIGYTLKYMAKKCKQVYGVEKPFALMSKGLGASYITGQVIKWHVSGRRMYCVLPGGKKISMSRYYKDKIFTPEMRKAVGVLTREDMLKEQSRLPVQDSAELAVQHAGMFKRMEFDYCKNEKL